MPATGDYPFVRTQLQDFSGEKQSISLTVGPITVGTIAGLLTNMAAWDSAINAVTLGVLTQSAFGVVDQVSNAKPSAKDAQVETRMLVGAIDAVTGAPWSFIIPTVDYTAFNYGTGSAGDEVIISGAGATTATTDLVDAIQDMAKYPGTTNALQVTYMKVVR